MFVQCDSDGDIDGPMSRAQPETVALRENDEIGDGGSTETVKDSYVVQHVAQCMLTLSSQIF